MRTKMKTRIMIEALMLCIVLTAIFLMMPFVNRVRYTYADKMAGDYYPSTDNSGENSFEDYNPYDYFDTEGQDLEIFLDSHLSNNGVANDYIEELDDRVQEIFFNYIKFDEDYHIFALLDTYDFEDRFMWEYYDVYERFGNIYSPYFRFYELDEEAKIELEEMLYCYTDEEGIEQIKFEIASMRKIRNNLNLMNRLVEEEVGYINDDFEFIFYETDEYVELWRAWGVKLSWNKLTVNFDKDWAITIAILIIFVRAFSFQYNINIAMNQLSDFKKFTGVISECVRLLPKDLQSGMEASLTMATVEVAFKMLIYSFSIIGSTNVVLTVFNIIFAAFMPSLVDGAIVLFNAFYLNKGVELKACWIPTWWDKWGVSIKSI